MEEKYQRYLQIPKYSLLNKSNSIYRPGWCAIIGRAIIAPHPHRHFTFEEFIEACKHDEKLNNL